MAAVGIALTVFLSVLTFFLTVSVGAVKEKRRAESSMFGKATQTVSVQGMKVARNVSGMLSVIAAILTAVMLVISAMFNNMAGAGYLLLLSDQKLTVPVSEEGPSSGEEDSSTGQVLGIATKHPGIPTRRADVGKFAAQAAMYAMTSEVRASTGVAGAFVYQNRGYNQPAYAFSCVTWVAAIYASIGLGMDGKPDTVFQFGKDGTAEVRTQWGSLNWKSQSAAGGVTVKDASGNDVIISEDQSNWGLLQPGDLLQYVQSTATSSGHVVMYVGEINGTQWTVQALSPGISVYCSPDLNDKNCSDVGFLPMDVYFSWDTPPSTITRPSLGF